MLIAKVVPTTLNNWCQNELATPTGCFDKWTIVFLNKVKSLYKFAKTAGAKAIGFPLAKLFRNRKQLWGKTKGDNIYL